MVPRANIAGTAPAHTNGSAAKFGRRFSGCCSMVSGNISHFKKEKSMGRLVFKDFKKMCSWECRNVEQMHSPLSSFFWHVRAFTCALLCVHAHDVGIWLFWLIGCGKLLVLLACFSRLQKSLPRRAEQCFGCSCGVGSIAACALCGNCSQLFRRRSGLSLR